MKGALLVAGTSSDAGKTTIVAALCRHLSRQGTKVAPFKAQNMALNSYVTLDGAEIGRSQALQAAAAGVEPEAAMNPVLLKPGGGASTQVVVLGRPAGEESARSYQARKAELLDVAVGALEDLRSRYDVVLCEGAGSPAEINLRASDLANMGLARAAHLPVIVVGDIDRGGVFAALHGTVALLDAADQALVAGFVINRFRGDRAVLEPGLAQIAALTGRPVLGVVPHRDEIAIDAEDSLALDARREDAGPPVGRDGIDVAVLRFDRISNVTDLDALACEPGVTVRLTRSAADVARADLVVLPGTRATVHELGLLRARGIDEALRRRARRGDPILGICGGYQILGEEIVDEVESRAGRVDGLGLLPVRTVFAPDKILARPRGTSPAFGGVGADGYEIHHGRVDVRGGAPLLSDVATGPEGCLHGAVAGTLWHGVLEGDAFRRALLAWVAASRGLSFVPAPTSFAAVREARLDALADLVAAHVDTAVVERLIAEGPPPGLPLLPPGART